MTSADRRERILARTREALRTLGEVDAELERREGRPPSVSQFRASNALAQR